MFLNKFRVLQTYISLSVLHATSTSNFINSTFVGWPRAVIVKQINICEPCFEYVCSTKTRAP